MIPDLLNKALMRCMGSVHQIEVCLKNLVAVAVSQLTED